MRRSRMLAVSENDSVAGKSLHKTATPSERTWATMVRLTCTAWLGPDHAIPAEYRGPFVQAMLGQQNGRAIGRRDFENAFEHLFFERLQTRAPNSPLY